MKVILFILALLSISAALTDKEIIQQGLNGLFEENKLADPTTIVPCIDDESAHKIVVFIGQLLEKAARGSLTDLLSLPQLIKDFGASLDPAVGTCLDGNAELAALSDAFGVTGMDSSTIEKKVITYVTLHYLTVHKWLGGLNDDWKAAKYYQVGFNAAVYGHTVLGTKKISDLKTEVQKIMTSANKIAKLMNLRSIF